MITCVPSNWNYTNATYDKMFCRRLTENGATVSVTPSLCKWMFVANLCLAVLRFGVPCGMCFGKKSVCNQNLILLTASKPLCFGPT